MRQFLRVAVRWPAGRGLLVLLVVAGLPVTATAAATSAATTLAVATPTTATATAAPPDATAAPAAAPAAVPPGAGPVRAERPAVAAPSSATPANTANTGNTGNTGNTAGVPAAAGPAGSAAAAEKLYQFQPDHAPELQQFTGRPWWDILSFCSGAMMAIKTEPEAQAWVRDEALRQLTLTLLPLLKQTGQPMEQLRAMSAKYAQGLQETRFLREEPRQAGVMRVCLLLIPTQFRKDSLAPAAP